MDKTFASPTFMLVVTFLMTLDVGITSWISSMCVHSVTSVASLKRFNIWDLFFSFLPLQENLLAICAENGAPASCFVP